MKYKSFRWFIHISGFAMIANGLWMVGGAIAWFFNIPADMPATGHPNGHLIRDVGMAYVVFGIALNWCAMNLANRRPLVLMVAAFMVAHALGHIVEILLGLLPESHWWIDLPVVLLPGLLFALIAIPGIWGFLIADADSSTR